MLNRSVINGVVGERLSLEATGLLNVSEDDGENNSLNIDELAVFFFEYADVDGERILQHTQFEAMADFVLIDEETRLDVSLNGFTSVERWEDGGEPSTSRNSTATVHLASPTRTKTPRSKSTAPSSTFTPNWKTERP